MSVWPEINAGPMWSRRLVPPKLLKQNDKICFGTVGPLGPPCKHMCERARAWRCARICGPIIPYIYKSIKIYNKIRVFCWEQAWDQLGPFRFRWSQQVEGVRGVSAWGVAGMLAALAWMPSAQATERGIASTYRGHGRTASGELLDATRLTCAHRTLPMNTPVKVCTRTRCVVGRVNDRGPARWTRRVIDLGPAMARALHLRGVERVVVEVAEAPAPTMTLSATARINETE